MYSSISEKIRRMILHKYPNHIKVKIAENGWTVLHHATSKDDLASIVDILRLYPECSEEVDNNDQNFLHLAVKNKNMRVVQHVLAMKEMNVNMLNAEDKDGNTPFHLAVLTENKTLTECFLYEPRVIKTTKNKEGQEALAAITFFEYDKTKAGIFGSSNKLDRKEWREQSQFDLVVGALIGAVSFTTGLTVPGGYISDGPDQGMAALSHKASFVAFVISNNFALMFSLYAVFSHFCTRRFHKQEDIHYQLNLATFCTFGGIFAMMIAFITGSYTVLANSNPLSIATCVHCGCFFIFAFRAMWKMASQMKLAGISFSLRRSSGRRMTNQP